MTLVTTILKLKCSEEIFIKHVVNLSSRHVHYIVQCCCFYSLSCVRTCTCVGVVDPKTKILYHWTLKFCSRTLYFAGLKGLMDYTPVWFVTVQRHRVVGSTDFFVKQCGVEMHNEKVTFNKLLNDRVTCLIMMTSSNGNVFRVTGLLCGEFTGPQWIPRTKASDAELWSFLWSAPE